KLKMAVLAPMPIASDSTATAAKPGLPANMRAAYCTSCHARSSHVRIQLECRRSVMTGSSRGLDDCGHGLVLFRMAHAHAFPPPRDLNGRVRRRPGPVARTWRVRDLWQMQGEAQR